MVPFRGLSAVKSYLIPFCMASCGLNLWHEVLNTFYQWGVLEREDMMGVDM